MEKVYFNNGKLSGILDKENPDFCVILCHGIGVDKEECGIFPYLAKELCKNGFSVFRFDFRAHGESEGKQENFTIKCQEKDILSAVKFLQKKGYNSFGILGASFAGGAVSLFSAKHEKIMKFVILWYSIIDYNSILHPELPWPKKYFSNIKDDIKTRGCVEVGSSKFKMGKELVKEMEKLKPWKELQKLKIPILFVHGDKDTYVPYEDSLKYSRLLKAKMKTIRGAEHGFEKNKKEASKIVVEFIKECLCITSQ